MSTMTTKEAEDALIEADPDEWCRCYTCDKLIRYEDSWSPGDADGPLCDTCDTEVSGRVHATVPAEPAKKKIKPDPHLVRHILGQVGTMSGRRYRLDLANMTAEQIRELHRLLRDIENDHRGKINKLRREPWRRF